MPRAMEEEVVAELDLREEQPMLAAGLLPLPGGKAFKKGISTLLEVDAVLAHSVGGPVMLIEADPSGERKVYCRSLI